MYYGFKISDYTANLARQAELDCAEVFRKIDENALTCSAKVLTAFQECRVSTTDFLEITGYGYYDAGRDKLEEVYAHVFGAEDALVRPQLMSGTHALAVTLGGLLKPGETLLYVTGTPYDTLQSVIGTAGDSRNSLIKYGVRYEEIDLKGNEFDLDAIRERVAKGDIKVAAIQRSRGYAQRKSLYIDQIAEAVKVIKDACPDTIIMVDNCYGEFTEELEPPAVGADLAIGSLIKNPGGGMAETGGYLAGSARAVELCSYRLTCPGIGLEVGATLGESKNMYRGLFYAPHTVAQALKTAHFAAYVFRELGFAVEPAPEELRSDIIQTVITGSAEALCAFCRGIQAGSPVDAYVTPEPWEMPGYQDKVIMAAGAFVQGASIELSADGPLKPPYTAFFQGGLTFESGRIGVLSAAAEILKVK